MLIVRVVVEVLVVVVVGDVIEVHVDEVVDISWTWWSSVDVEVTLDPVLLVKRSQGFARLRWRYYFN